MARFSFFDHEKRDFLRYDNGQLIVIEAEDFHEAEDWLLTEGETYGWTNTGVNYYNWDDELKLQAPR